MSYELFKNVTVVQFKEYFFRDFPFLPIYDATETYFEGDIVYKNGNFFSSLINCNLGHDVSEEGYWKPVRVDKYEYVLDQDITKALNQALINSNERFGEDDNDKVIIFLHLVAYYLLVDLKNSSVGINSAYGGLVSSKSVGDVSESYAIPQWLMNSPMYSMYSQNGYGLKYLSLIAPYLAVTVLYSSGGTTVG